LPPILTGVTERAHALGLLVHPYTFRADDLPEYAESFEHLLHLFFSDLGVDGIFTDFPDLAYKFLSNQK